MPSQQPWVNPPSPAYNPNRPRIHRVKMGETLASIAKQYGLTAQQLLSYNPRASQITAGVSLSIPYNPQPSAGANAIMSGIRDFGSALGSGVRNWMNSWNNNVSGAINPGQQWGPVQSQGFMTVRSPQGGLMTAQSGYRPSVAQANPSLGAPKYTPTAANNFNWGAPPATPPASTGISGTEILAGYKPTAVNNTTAAGAGGQDLSRLSQKELNEYSGYLDWVGRDPNRLTRYQQAGYDMSYESYLNSKYSGGGGDFWGYMQSIQSGNQASPGQPYKQVQKHLAQRFADRNKNYNEVGVPNYNQYANNGYSNYYSPNSFGVVTWRGW